MASFQEDYESGHRQKRYLNASLPSLPFGNDASDPTLCSHFLFLYSHHLDLDFHVDAIKELGCVVREVRIYLLVVLDGLPPPYIAPV